MQTLHDYDDRAVSLVKAGRNRLLIPVDDVLTHQRRGSLASLVRVVDDDGAAERLAHLRGAVAGDRSVSAGRVDDPALRCAEFILGLTIVLQRRPWEDRAICFRLHRRAHLVGVRGGEALGIGRVDELGIGIEPHRPRDEILHRRLRFAGSRRDVDDEPVGLAD